MASTKQLPGMEDNKIEALEEAAHEYIKYRDRRLQMLVKEVELKTSVLKLMKRHHKETYRSENIEINIVVEEEGVKVKEIKAPKPKTKVDGDAS